MRTLKYLPLLLLAGCGSAPSGTLSVSSTSSKSGAIISNVKCSEMDVPANFGYAFLFQYQIVKFDNGDSYVTCSIDTGNVGFFPRQIGESSHSTYYTAANPSSKFECDVRYAFHDTDTNDAYAAFTIGTNGKPRMDYIQTTGGQYAGHFYVFNSCSNG